MSNDSKEPIYIYTDASLRGKKKFTFGYTILDYEGDNDLKFGSRGTRNLLKEYLGYDKKVEFHSSSAESFAILHCLRELRKMNVSDDIVFYTDSKNTCEAFYDLMTIKTGEKITEDDRYIKRGEKFMANKERTGSLWQFVIDELKEEVNQYLGKIEIKWIKGHADLYGNEVADAITKEGWNNGKRRKSFQTPNLKYLDTFKTFFTPKNESDKLLLELNKLIYDL